MIVIKDLHKTFNRGQSSETPALVGIDLVVAKGEYLVLVGANGSGKSTLLNCIAGSYIPDRGEIWIGEKNVTRLKDYERSAFISRIFQNPLAGTAPDLSILENFRLASLRTEKKILKTGINKTFTERVKAQVSELGMGLENKLQQNMGSLSGGQRQALTLLMAVMADTRILLLDEPTAALDPRSSDLILKMADALIRTHGLTAILVTHQLKDAHRYGTRIVQLHEGKVLRDLQGAEKQRLELNTIFNWFS